MQTSWKLFTFAVPTFLFSLSHFLMGFGPHYSWNCSCKVTCYLHKVKCRDYFSLDLLLDLSVHLTRSLSWNLLFLWLPRQHDGTLSGFLPSHWLLLLHFLCSHLLLCFTSICWCPQGSVPVPFLYFTLFLGDPLIPMLLPSPIFQ